MMSNHFRSLLNRAEARFSEDTAAMSMTDWVCTNTTIKGRPFSISDYPFQRAILDDMHPNMDVKKCSQIGLTEIEIRKVLAFLSRYRGTSAIFTLPNLLLHDKVSKTRVRPIVDKDRVFNPDRGDGVKPVRSKDIMQIGDSWLYMTGCSEADATSTSADFVANDEVDISPQDMLALFNSRLQNSVWKINQRFSTPTFASFGVDMGFRSSDQRLYKVRCDCCNHWNWPEFTRNFIEIPGLPDHIEELIDIDDSFIDDIDIVNACVVCEKCRSPLDLGREDNREWVAKYPGRTHARGYHITPFSTNRLPPSYIITQLLRYKRRDYLRGFYNTVLGMEYSGGNIRLSREEIEACLEPQMMPPKVGKDENVFVGIDMGQTVNLVLGRGNSPETMRPFNFMAFHVDEIHTKVAEILDTYNVVGGAVDRHPYTPTSKALFEQSDGRIVPAEYRGTKDVGLVKDAAGNFTHAQVDRTGMLDLVVRCIRKQTLKMSGYRHYRPVLIEHLMDMVRDEKPDEPAVWLKSPTGNDHFFHALGFLLIAARIKEVERAVSKDDQRTTITSIGANVHKRTPSLIGLEKRKFVSPMLQRI